MRYTSLQYFYHPDHLGSASWITDADGNGYQHLQYLPPDSYRDGESWVEQRLGSYNTPYQFSGKEKDEETGYNYFGARYYDSELSVWLSVDPMADKYPRSSPFVYTINNPIKFIDPDGKRIVLAGTQAEQQQTLQYLQKLTNDKLGINSKGEMIIIRMGGENKGTYLKAGNQLIRELNQKGPGTKTIIISIGAPGSNNSASTADRTATGALDWTNATNAVGADATVNFDPTSNPKIPTKDPITGDVTGATRPNEIGLSHELIHGRHINKGTVDFTFSNYTYQTPTGNVTYPVMNEELRTVGLAGKQPGDVTENDIRKENGLNERGAY